MDLLVANSWVSPGSLEPLSKKNPKTSFSGSAALTLDSPFVWMWELLPALGRAGAFISLKTDFLGVFSTSQRAFPPPYSAPRFILWLPKLIGII